ncbi:MAG: hypothetical protein M3R02_11445 [Chloroflexota bacterium]|nr:hypothetical protein [Chloroflexota bacterium]
MSSKPATPQPASPLDPFLIQFLRHVADLDTGYSPASHARAIAESAGLLPPFVDALFTSARARGLLEPFRSPRARGRTRWRLTSRGRALLTRTPDIPPPQSPGNER